MVHLVVLGDSLYCSCLAIALRLLLLVKHCNVKLVGVEKSSRPGAVTLCDNRAPRGQPTHTYSRSTGGEGAVAGSSQTEQHEPSPFTFSQKRRSRTICAVARVSRLHRPSLRPPPAHTSRVYTYRCAPPGKWFASSFWETAYIARASQ